MKNFSEILNVIRSVYKQDGFIPLHAPVFKGKEKDYVVDAIDSTYVSSVGAYVNRCEEMLAEFTGAKYAIATGNGTSALHAAMVVGGVKPGDEVLSQAFTFVATANAISYCGAYPVFIDIDKDTAGMSPISLSEFLDKNADFNDKGECINKKSGRVIRACVPMHTFGLVARIEEIANVCKKYNIKLIEDAAESIGSYCNGKHTGLFGSLGTLSFNGNKVITSGGGGAIITNDESIAKLAKHITTTAKRPHAWDFYHDMIGFNYRLPNLNAALLCAQIEQLNGFIASKANVSKIFHEKFNEMGLNYLSALPGTKSNYWLNTIIFENKEERNSFLEYSNSNDIMSRPAWMLMSSLPMYKDCQSDGLSNSLWLEDRLVNIPSSVV